MDNRSSGDLTDRSSADDPVGKIAPASLKQAKQDLFACSTTPEADQSRACNRPVGPEEA